jgi:hypothetical protein
MVICDQDVDERIAPKHLKCLRYSASAKHVHMRGENGHQGRRRTPILNKQDFSPYFRALSVGCDCVCHLDLKSMLKIQRVNFSSNFSNS